jgi:hypothetical protein
MFECRNQIIRYSYILPAIQGRKKLQFQGQIIFKWLTVLYVDPQNLMTNRRKPPFGNGCRFRGKNNAGNKV